MDNKRRILIVDDEDGFTRLVKMTLESTGKYEVREENDGTQALSAALEFRPDLVFLDVIMPNTDGGDVAAQLGRAPRLAGIPIVFLTAIVSQSEGGEGTFGGFPFLPKPVSLDSLTRCIDSQLGKL